MTGVVRDDATGHIGIVYEVATHRTGGNADQYSIRYAYWDGATWTSHVIDTSIDTGLSIVTHSCLDSMDRAYVCKPVSSVFEMSRYDTTDHGATWVRTILTTGSANTGNIYPAAILNRDPNVRVLWLFGTYTTYLSNSLGIKASG